MAYAFWDPTTARVAIQMVVGLVLFLFLWYGPLLLARTTVERLRPVAYGIVLADAAFVIWNALSGPAHSLLWALLVVSALAYAALTWSDRYLDRLERHRLRSMGGRRLGRWRRGVDRAERDR